MLVVGDLHSLEFIFTSSKVFDKSFGYEMFHNWLGTGLLISSGKVNTKLIEIFLVIKVTFSGDKWRKHRKIITPAFHFQILPEFIDAFNTNSDILISKLMGQADKGSFDIYPYINRCALDIICGNFSHFLLQEINPN